MAEQLIPLHEQYFRNVFEQFDENGDNLINKQQLRLLMAALGENLNEAMVDQLVSQIDQDSDGQIDCEQFLHLMSIIMKRADPNTEFKKAFAIFDRDGNGSISSSELKQVMANLDNPLSTAQAEQIYRRIGKQEMDLEQFIALLMTTQP